MTTSKIASVTVDPHPTDAGKCIAWIAYDDKLGTQPVEVPMHGAAFVSGLDRYQGGIGPVKKIEDALPDLSPTYQALFRNWVT